MPDVVLLTKSSILLAFEDMSCTSWFHLRSLVILTPRSFSQVKGLIGLTIIWLTYRRYAFVGQYALHLVDGRFCCWWLPEECYFTPVTVSIDHPKYVFPHWDMALENPFRRIAKVPLVIPMLLIGSWYRLGCVARQARHSLIWRPTLASRPGNQQNCRMKDFVLLIPWWPSCVVCWLTKTKTTTH